MSSRPSCPQVSSLKVQVERTGIEGTQTDGQTVQDVQLSENLESSTTTQRGTTQRSVDRTAVVDVLDKTGNDQSFPELETVAGQVPRTTSPGECGTTRTTGSGGRSCKRCGEPVRGRRRNGYCSDRCRRRDEREAQRRNRLVLMAALRDLVAAVECELGVGGGRE